MSKTFYINTYHYRGKTRVGLFTQKNHVGRGTCCGWYASEFFTDTVLLASYASEESTYHGFDPYHTNEKDIINILKKFLLIQICGLAD
jgi:hypothetical protein